MGFNSGFKGLRAGVEQLETNLAERKICVQAAMKDLATLPYV